MYPHQLLMEENNLQKGDLSKEVQGYIKDFDNFLRGVKLKEGKANKAGKEFQVAEKDNEKLIRLSKSASLQIYEDIERISELKRQEDEKQRKEAEMLAEQQRQEDERIQAESERLKAEQENPKDREETQSEPEYQDEEEEQPKMGFFF